MAHLSYQPGRTRPDYCGIYHADVVTGVYAFGAISAALYQRHDSHKGQHIDVSMLELMLSLTLNEVQWSQFEVTPPSRADVWPGRDRGWICDGRDRQREDVPGSCPGCRPSRNGSADPRFAKYADRRHQLEGFDGGRRDLVAPAYDRKMPCRTECVTAFPVRPIAPLPKRMRDPQIAHRGALAEVDDGGGTFKVMNLPFRMSGANVAAGKRDGNPRRTHGRLLQGERPLGR